MSPRAAWRLESLGFRDVYDYPAGKTDWLAAGLPTEGELSDRPRAGDVADPDVPTCALDERIGDVRRRVEEAGWNVSVVVNEHRVVLGLLRETQLQSDDDASVERVMRPGPSTFRPHVPVQEMAEHMARHDVRSAPITTSDGRLVGMLTREAAERAARELQERLHRMHEAHRQHDHEGPNR
jgi:CBS domain-containing protein